jgi:RNA polymerase sigma-70 factor (ECF subfamily)
MEEMMNDESKYGPQTVEIEALLARANALTVGEMQELDALWGSAWGDTLDEAKRAAWYAVGGAAHDAAHETFLRLLTAQPDSIRSPESWLFGVARHVCIDVARRDSKMTDELFEDGETTVLRAVSRPAEDEVLSQDDARALLLALRRVRPRYRAALILREIHHEPIDVVAESLGVRVGAASTILSRARDAFGRAYAEVLGLENGCREAVGMIYRRTGSGLSSVEETVLEAHLATCAGCRKEAGRAGETLGSNAILLLLPVSGGAARGIFARALELVARDQSVVHALSAGGSAPEVPATRVATSVVAAVIALTVGLAGVSPGPSAPAPGSAGT